jgi:sigma-B regulation protein RsbU (phosphoserine phosphatase)
MQTSFSPRRLLRRLLGILFAASATTYGVLWVAHWKQARPQPGFTNYEYSAVTRSMNVGVVFPGSPADQAGLRPGDRILAIDGQRLDDLRPYYESIVVGQNDVVELSVEHPSSTAEPERLRLVLRGGQAPPKRTTRLEGLLWLPIDYYPLGFLVVGLAVLILRPDDPNAWLLALLFGGFIAGGPLLEGAIPPVLRGFAVFYKIIMSWTPEAIFYYFFAVFPARSLLDRKLPWLKYALLAVAIVITFPIAFRCLFAGDTRPLYRAPHWPGTAMLFWVVTAQAGLPSPASHGWPSLGLRYFGFYLAGIALGLLSLVSNAFLSTDAHVRRKARVMVWGTVVGVVPVCSLVVTAFAVRVQNVPLVFWQLSVLFLSFVWPLSFAYAVVKHRVLEIPLLLKRSARYILVQRGFIVLLFVAAAAAIALFTHTISRFFPASADIGMAASAAFGIVLVWVSAPVVKRGTERIDRAFFRSAYDARVILQDLAEKTRKVTDRYELATLLELQIAGALHPKSLACYLEAGDGNLVVEYRRMSQQPEKTPDAPPPPLFPFRFGARFVLRDADTIPASLPLLVDLARGGKAWDVPSPLADEAGAFPALAPECLVPILSRSSGLIGLLVLGQRLSEEPYSGEDKSLLESVASQAGITLENIALAEKMAERIEVERRAALEMDIARRVQARLFPQKLPPLHTFEYVGGCVQARQVGGDYYDFLDMGPGVMGIVLADISGKGMSAALLMANLQANLRSQYAVALDDLPRLLQSVNRLFYENTTDESYATMFFGVYDDSQRSLRYANCGHIAPMILRAGGSIQRLTSTTTVLGLFSKWDSPIAEEKLHPGDLLVICTDGVTEAPNPQAEEYGEVRLAEIIQTNRGLPVNELLAAIQTSVQDFTGGTQADDVTLIVARCH